MKQGFFFYLFVYFFFPLFLVGCFFSGGGVGGSKAISKIPKTNKKVFV